MDRFNLVLPFTLLLFIVSRCQDGEDDEYQYPEPDEGGGDGEGDGNGNNQSSLDGLILEVEAIKEAIKGLPTITERLTGVESTIDELKTEVAATSAAITELGSAGGGDNGGSDSGGEQVAAAVQAVSDMQSQVGSLEEMIIAKFAQLDKINELWRRNFKIVNNTFARQKKGRRVRFRIRG